MAQTGNPFDCLKKSAGRTFATCGNTKKEGARVSAHAFVKKGVIPEDYTPAQLVTLLLAAEQDCTAVILRKAAGGYDGGSPTTGPGRGRVKEETTGKKHTVTGVDFDYIGNEEFWNAFLVNASDYEYFFFTQSRAWPVRQDISATAGGAIEDDPDTTIKGAFTITWNNIDNPVSHTADVKTLDIEPFLAFTGLTAGGAGNDSTITGETVTVANAGSVDVKINITGATNWNIGDTTPLPNWLTLTEAGHLTGVAPASDSTTKLVINGATDCGIVGEVTITVVVA